MGRKHTEITKEKIRMASILQFSDPIVRQRHREIGKAVWQNTEYRERQVVAHRGKTLPLEQRIKMGRKGRKFSEKTRGLIAESSRKRWASYTPERRREISAPGLVLATPAARKARPSSIERAVHAVLDALQIQYRTEESFGRYSADIFIPEAKLVIECDGSYWHSRPGSKEADAKKDAYLCALGFRVIRLSEQEILQDAKEAVLLKLVS